MKFRQVFEGKTVKERLSSSHEALFREHGYRKGKSGLGFGTKGHPTVPMTHEFHASGKAPPRELHQKLMDMGYTESPTGLGYQHPNGDRIFVKAKYGKGTVSPDSLMKPQLDKHSIVHSTPGFTHQEIMDYAIDSTSSVQRIAKARGLAIDVNHRGSA